MKYLVLFCCLLFTISCSNYTSSSAPIKKVVVHNIDQNQSLKQLMEQADREGKTPILYFHASWCKPCLNFKEALYDERLVQVFQNALLMGVDADKNPENLTAEYNLTAVPTFIKLDQNGKTLARITSGEWEEDIPQNIAPVMNNFINKKIYHN